jgi:MFS family permease
MEEKIWTKDFILTFFANFFTALTFYLLLVTLAAYATNRFHASASMAGLVVSIFAIGGLIARVFTGRYMEVIGRNLITRIGLVFYLLTALSYIPVKSLPFLIIVRFINGFSFGVVATCLQTIGMTLVPGSRRGEGTGYFMLSQNFATAAGPFTGLYLSGHFNYTVIFCLCSVCAAICFLLMLIVHIRNVELSDEIRKAACSGFKLKETIEVKAVPISVFMLLMSVCYGAIISFMKKLTWQLRQHCFLLFMRLCY